VSIAGDPGSCSQLGGALRQLAARLRTDGQPLRRALEPADAPRGGAAVARARRRSELVAAGVASAAAELDRVGSALQAHAGDLAQALADARAVADRAAAAGLEERHGRLVPRWGVAGVADGQASAEQEAARERLQSELDHVASLLRQRRSRLAKAVTASGDVLAGQAEGLRR
jgi:hypothetical protein